LKIVIRGVKSLLAEDMSGPPTENDIDKPSIFIDGNHSKRKKQATIPKLKRVTTTGTTKLSIYRSTQNPATLARATSRGEKYLLAAG
jgi:hypothetical protein